MSRSRAIGDAMPEWPIEPLRTASDLDALLAIEETCFTNPWTREMYQAELAHAETAFFMLARTTDGAVIGFCSYWRVLDELHINNLAVLPAYRRQGVARALLAHIMRDAAAHGAIRALLEVRRSNDPARRLYEGMGFTVAGTRRAYYTSPVEDALVLWCEHLDRPVTPPRESRHEDAGGP